MLVSYISGHTYAQAENQKQETSFSFSIMATARASLWHYGLMLPIQPFNSCEYIILISSGGFLKEEDIFTLT